MQQLQKFLKLVLNASNSSTITKGDKLLNSKRNLFTPILHDDKQIEVKVPSATSSDFYKVTIDVENQKEKCNCPAFNRYAECKHLTSACKYLLVEIAINNQPTDLKPVINDEHNLESINKYKQLRVTRLSNIDSRIYSERNYKSITNTNLKKIVFTKEFDKLYWNFTYAETAKIIFSGSIIYDGILSFKHNCNCTETTFICLHAAAAYTSINNSKKDSFENFRNYDLEKLAIFNKHNLLPESREAKAIQFSKDYYGNLTYTLPNWLVKNVDEINNFKNIFSSSKTVNNTSKNLINIEAETPGFVFMFNNAMPNLGIQLEGFKINIDGKGKAKFKKTECTSSNILLLKNIFSNKAFDTLYNLSIENIGKEFNFNYLHSDYYIREQFRNLATHEKNQIRKYVLQQIEGIWDEIAESENVYIVQKNEKFSEKIQKISLSKENFNLKFEMKLEKDYVTILLNPYLKSNENTFADFETYLINGLIFKDNILYKPSSIKDYTILDIMNFGILKFPINALQVVMNSVIVPLMQQYEVQLPANYNTKKINIKPVLQLELKEEGEFLILQPNFIYDKEVIEFGDVEINKTIIDTEGNITIFERNQILEKDLITNLVSLHPTFETQKNNSFFHLQGNEVIKDNWFITTMQQLKETNTIVMGIDKLKKFKINPNLPKWTMRTSSNIDWFEVNIVVEYGELEVPLSTIRKSLLGGEKYVTLSDGTLGVLPEQWLKKYGLMLKMGDLQKDESLQVNKLHFSLIDQLFDEIDDATVKEELNEKRKLLHNIDKIKYKPASKHLTAKLRQYQEFGLNWLQTLDSLGWGACLADDMGLGKTLQAISFLQFVKDKYKTGLHLVVCPTSLIYNWESELNKFAPKLKYHIHYGADRNLTAKICKQNDIIITTYGMVRSDFEEMRKMDWHYIILDESQAIKNPVAVTTKAVQLLPAKNRIILSGTPLQNNTFDLFAQFQFINKGLLGNGEFFKSEFANPIDKNNDAEKSEQLRKLIYPFILRRTKDQVATDLPAKTDSILWCEMGVKQRKVYDEYKNYYRDMLLERIEKDGMAKSGMYVLEGLLRLRQLCDSPVLVKNAKVITKESIKITELVREVEENMGNHKMLVFSQFVEMLALIKAELDAKGIAYCYLDGSTKAADRKNMVDNFQNNTDIKIFLMSIKAGGVGLNLTAADYVYIVDPWWNPAVEQQAIDRTHRIGQKQKIFSYRMICKNTVEEKIMDLQSKKKQLASDLITEDAGFIKKLTKDDISFLFT